MIKKGIILLSLFSVAAIFVVLRGLGQEEILALRAQIEQTGFWAPIIYILIYTFATALVLPSTMLNVTGGALFGVFWGIIWTTIAAVGSAILTFWVTRCWLRDWSLKKTRNSWQELDAEIRGGGFFYLLAIRLFPVIPYGVVNYSAGLTSVSFRDYLISTSLGTVPGLLPFVMLGASGIETVSTGQVWPVLLPLALISLLIAGTTWYQRRRKQHDSNCRHD